MSCIHCYSPPLHLLNLQKHRQNGRIPTNLCCNFYGYSTNKHSNIIVSQVGVLPLKVEDFPTSFTLAVVKPPNATVLIQTSAVMIIFYLIANFVVPQFITKSFDEQKEDANEKPNYTDLVDEGKASSATGKRGFNSKKPK